MKNIFKYSSFLILCFMCIGKLYAHTIKPADAILVVDGATNVVLRDEHADKIINPASFTKLMTTAIVLKYLAEGKVNLQQRVKITHDIWMKGGAPSGTSTMFAALNSEPTVNDLLHGLIIDSANDAAIALAKLIAGDEDKFASLMNAEAKRIGLKNSYFVNATGLPQTDGKTQKTNLHDMLYLLRYLRNTYPAYVSISQEPSFSWNKITQNNKNFLIKNKLDNIKGLSGLTAYSKQDQFMFLGCAQQNNRIIYLIFTGTSSKNHRLQEALNLLKWSYNNFNFHMVINQYEEVIKIPVFAGKAKEVSAIAAQPIYSLTNKDGENLTQIKIKYKTPLIAPVMKNSIIGVLSIYSQNQLKTSYNLIAKDTIKTTSFFKKFKAALYQITVGWIVNLVYYHLNNI